MARAIATGPAAAAIVFALAAAFASLAIGCRGGKGTRAAAGAQGSELLRAYPVLRWVPATASYVVVADRVDRASVGLRELIEAVSLVADPRLGAAELTREVRDAGWPSPFESGDLAQAGIAIDRSVAVVGHGLYPTLVLPVADVEVVDRVLEARRPHTNVRAGEHRGARVIAWRDTGVVFAYVDDWLLIHLGDPAVEVEGETRAWLDAILDARDGVGAIGGDSARPLIAAGRRLRAAGDQPASATLPAIVGYLHADAVLASAAPRVDPSVAGCVAAAPPPATPLWIAVDVPGDGNDGATMAMGIELGDGGAADVVGHQGPPPPPAFVEYDATTGIGVAWNLDLSWLAGEWNAHPCAGALGQLQDPATTYLGGQGPYSYHVTANQLSIDGANDGAVWMALRNRGPIDRQLDGIPGRRFIERTRTIGGLKVRVIDVPLGPKVGYLLADQSLFVAFGDAAMRRVFRAGDQRAPGPVNAGAIARLKVVPGRLPDLPGMLGLVGEAVGVSRRAAERAAHKLTRYEWVWATLALEGANLVLRAGMRLRP